MERYQRQTILKGFGLEGQTKLSNSRVLVVGAGGLGVPVVTYLNAMGVGTLGIVDNDTVSISNLHRQVIYSEDQVGKPKVAAIKEKLEAQNSETKIDLHETFLSASNVFEILEKYDLIVDASDNFPTRYLVNDACVIFKKPFVYGALHGFEGQVSVFNYKNGPTYRCLYPNMPKANEVPNCNEHGVLGILPGIIGNLQALEAIKIISGIGNVLSGTLLLFDGLTQSMQKMKFMAKPENTKLKKLAASYELDCEIPLKSIEAIAFTSLLADKDLELIDVRTVEEFENGHLKPAKNIPLDILENQMDRINKTKPVYVICQSGIRSQKAIVLLQAFFPKSEFINVIGGMNHINTYANIY
jgi:adenylyltransferase/sulfurtransferase